MEAIATKGPINSEKRTHRSGEYLMIGTLHLKWVIPIIIAILGGIATSISRFSDLSTRVDSYAISLQEQKKWQEKFEQKFDKYLEKNDEKLDRLLESSVKSSTQLEDLKKINKQQSIYLEQEQK